MVTTCSETSLWAVYWFSMEMMNLAQFAWVRLQLYGSLWSDFMLSMSSIYFVSL